MHAANGCYQLLSTFLGPYFGVNFVHNYVRDPEAGVLNKPYSAISQLSGVAIPARQAT